MPPTCGEQTVRAGCLGPRARSRGPGLHDTGCQSATPQAHILIRSGLVGELRYRTHVRYTVLPLREVGQAALGGRPVESCPSTVVGIEPFSAGLDRGACIKRRSCLLADLGPSRGRAPKSARVRPTRSGCPSSREYDHGEGKSVPHGHGFPELPPSRAVRLPQRECLRIRTTDHSRPEQGRRRGNRSAGESPSTLRQVYRSLVG